MSLAVAVILSVVVVGITILVFLNRKFAEFSKMKHEDQSLLLLHERMEEMSRVVDQKMGESVRIMQHQFTESAKIIQDVTEHLVKLDETNKNVLSFADQLQSLQDILKNPKQRGILGEYYLETVLKNVLPPQSYALQYRFPDGAIVDAVIFLQDKMVPIDAKFSLENYNRITEERDPLERGRLEKVFKQDLRNRIEETAKYIRPEENTLDFAFMFIPAEAIYYDLLVNQVGNVKVNTKDLIEYAFREKRVVIVSPTSFFAYLQTVLQGLRAMQIEESAKEIKKRVEQLGRHLGSYHASMQKLGAQLGATINTYNTAYGEFKKIDKDVVKMTGGESVIHPVELERPKEE